jgi:hypothetical protein
MRRSATLRGLSDDERAPIDDCADYLLKYGSLGIAAKCRNILWSLNLDDPEGAEDGNFD